MRSNEQFCGGGFNCKKVKTKMNILQDKEAECRWGTKRSSNFWSDKKPRFRSDQ